VRVTSAMTVQTACGQREHGTWAENSSNCYQSTANGSTSSINPAPASVRFKVRHMVGSNVRVEFRNVRGEVKQEFAARRRRS